MGLKTKNKSKESETGKSEKLVQFKVSKSVRKIKAQLNKAISVKKSTSGMNMKICELCEYKCIKIITLKKHMAINHKDHKDNEDIGCSSGDEIFNLSEIIEHTSEKDKTKKSFVFSESMLDEWDPLVT